MRQGEPTKPFRDGLCYGICLEVGMAEDREQRIVRLFRNGRNQAVRIPREFEFDADEAVMRRDGERLILEPVPRPGLLAYLATLEPIDEPFPDIDADLPPLDEPALDVPTLDRTKRDADA